MKFLVVDDEKFIRDVLTGILENLGYEYKEASNGSVALDIQKTFKADILLTDIRMPGMSGIELALKIYNKYKIPIILISGYTAPNDMDKIKDIEHYFFSKPIKVNDLSERIEILSQKVKLENSLKEEKVEEEISLDGDIGDDDFYDDELMDEFLTEGFDMLDDVEPRLIETAETVLLRPCWETKECGNKNCPLFKFPEFVPCWTIKSGVNDRKENIADGEVNPVCLECDIYNDRKIDISEIDAIFRVFHSFKGSSSFLGLDTITSLTHEAESIMDFIRKDIIVIVPEIIDILMDGVDALRLSMRAITDESLTEEADENAGRIIVDLKEKITYIEEKLFLEKILSGETKNMSEADIVEDIEVTEAYEETAEIENEEEVSIEFEISDEIKEKFAQESAEIIDIVEDSFLQMEKDASNPVLLSNAFRNIHSFKGNCGFMGYKDMENVSHKMESILENLLDDNMTIDTAKIPILLDMLDLVKGALGDISKGEDGSISGLDNMLKSLEDELGMKFENPGKFAAATEPEPEPETKKSKPKVDPIPKEKAKTKAKIEKKKIEPKELKQEVKKKELEIVNAKVSQTKAKSKVKVAKAKSTKNEVKRTDIRVDLEKLDILMDLVGELVIAGAMVSSNDDVKDKGFEDFEKSSVHLNSIIKDLQDVAMNVRMIPIAGTFSKMMRLVHDLARKSKKKVKLITSGEQTEVDKTVIEMIGDPLVHIIRNAVDHGIEPEDIRKEANKGEFGNVSLDARYEGGEVWITIKDDGKGLKREVILNKGIEKGLVEGDGSDMSDSDVFRMIFEPGFSTAAQVTEVSGRGVGMDVVKKNIEKLKGTIDIKSEEGIGTTFILRIPLTLAIIEGMLVRVGDTKYVIPILAILESVIIDESQITIAPDGSETVKIREKLLPIVRVYDLHKINPDSVKISEGILITVQYRDKQVCLFVDEILGQESIVVKGLSDYIGHVGGVSGCTILGNGDICLILDIGTLLTLSEDKV